LSKQKIQGKVVFSGRDTFGELTVADKDGIRSLYFGEGIVQSSLKLGHPSVLLMDYSQAMLTPLLFNERPERVLVVGLGGGSLVNFLLERCPDCAVHAIEISPAVIRVAHDYFDLPRQNSRLQVLQADAREAVREMEASGLLFDLILLDAFDEDGPAAVLMQEDFLISCKRLLRKNGICSINLWTWPRGNFFETYEMIGSVFGGNAGKIPLEESYQNVVVLACDDASRYADLMSYRARARQMQRKWGVNFPTFLMRIGWQRSAAEP